MFRPNPLPIPIQNSHLCRDRLLYLRMYQQLQSQGKNLDGFLAYNVSFTDADGNPVEPSDKVSLLVLIMAAVTVDAAGSVSSGEEASL